MALRGGQPGNQNGAKGKEWTAALKWALKKYDKNSIKRGQALRQIALKVVEDALEGKEAAWREIAERHDGKIGTGDGQGPVKIILLGKFTGDEPQPLPLTVEAQRIEHIEDESGG